MAGRQGSVTRPLRLARCGAVAHYPRMLLSLTRNRLSARVLGLACALAGAAVLASPAGAAGAPESTVVRVRVGSPASSPKAAQDSVVFELTGSSAARCFPSLAAASVVGADVDLRLRWPASGCVENRSAPFTLTANAASITGTPLPRGLVYHVSVHDEDGNLLAFRVLETDMMKNWPTPENGFWWPQPDDAAGAPVAMGSGVGIESQGHQLAINVFGFGDTGAPVWYFAGARQNGRVVSASLLQLQHGDGLFASNGSRPVAQAGPRIELEFLSSSEARAWLVESDGNRDVDVREIRLARTPFARDASAASRIAGRWVLVSDAEAAPRQFTFAEQPASGPIDAVLTDADADASLTCRLDTGTQAAKLCSLTVAGTLLADFDSIGLDRLGGRASDGTSVQLLRVPQKQ